MSGAISQDAPTPAPAQTPSTTEANGVETNGTLSSITTDIDSGVTRTNDDNPPSPVSPIATRKPSSTSTAATSNRKTSVVQGRRVQSQTSSNLNKATSKTWTPTKTTTPSASALNRTLSPTFKDIVNKFNKPSEEGPARSSSPMGLRKASVEGSGGVEDTKKNTKNASSKTMPPWKPGGSASGNTGLRQRPRDSKALRSPTSVMSEPTRRRHTSKDLSQRDMKDDNKRSSPPRGRRESLAPNSRPTIRSSRSTPPLRSGAHFNDDPKAASLAAYINAPSGTKPPPLRSTRPRPSATTTTKIPVRSETGSGLHSRFAKDNEAKSSSKPKKKIPELNSVDFAARRKMIASAFNDRMDKARREEATARARKAEKKAEMAGAPVPKDGDGGEKVPASTDDAEGTEDSEKQSSVVGLGLTFSARSVGETDAGPISPVAAGAGEGTRSVNESIDPADAINQDGFQEGGPIARPDSPPSASAPIVSPKSLEKSASYSTPPMPLRQAPQVNLNENYQVTTIIVESPEELQSPRSAIPEEGQRSPRPPPSPPTILEPPPDNALINLDVWRRGSKVGSISSRRGSIGSKSGSIRLEDTPRITTEEWQRAEADEQARRTEIERERDMKIKNRHSLPPPPSPTFVSGEFDEASKLGHRKQSSLASSPNLAPPGAPFMWQFRPSSTAGESMIDNYYGEQEELVAARARKHRIAEGTASQEDMDNDQPRYQLHDNEYNVKAPAPADGYVSVTETYVYGRESKITLDPNDYWTPVPAQSEFGSRSVRQSWMTTDTREPAQHLRVSSVSSKIMDRMRPIGEGPPPTPPPKDFKMQHQKPPPVPPLPDKGMYDLPGNIEVRRSSLPASLGQPSPGFAAPAGFTDLKFDDLKSPKSLAPSENTFEGVPFSSTSSNYSEDNSSAGQQNSFESAQMYSVMSPSTSILTGTDSFVSKEPVSAEQKRLNKRHHLLKELVDTEKSFFLDMTVTLEIYKGTTGACDDLKPDDVRAIFGNTDAVVAFSRSFIETLKAAVASVYVPPRSGEKPGATPAESRVNSSSASLATMGSNNLDGENSCVNDDEKDRRSWVGEAFGQALPRMEKIYGDYCKNHEIAVAKLQVVEKTKGVGMWLRECKEAAEDLTNAWSLESLLIKPVQRIMKYPLLLNAILECTPQDHPDYTAIDLAAREIRTAAERINESKKRKDLMDKIVGPRKRAETDIRHGLTKGLVRRAEKLRQSVGLSEQYKDENYEEAVNKFRTQYFQIQVLMKDIEMCLTDVEKQVNDFHELATKFEEYSCCLPTKFKDYIVRWKDFTSRAKELKDTSLPEHKRRIKAHCIVPLEKVMKMGEHPQKVMAKRDKKSVDYARFRAVKDKGDKPDKKLSDLADAYLAINETLLDELPKLHSLTESMVSVVVGNFAELMYFWDRNWYGNMVPLLDPLDIPSNFSDIIEVYRGDFKVEPMMQAFTITNSQSRLWQMNSFVTTSATSLSLETDGASLHRPTTGMSDHSLASVLPANTPRHEKRLSGGIINSPFLAAVAHSIPAQAVVQQQQQQPPQGVSSRDRSSSSTGFSSVSASSSSQPARPNVARTLSAATAASVAPARPHTSSGSTSVHSGHSSITSPPLPPLPIQDLDSALEPRSNPSTRPNSSAGQSSEALGYKVLWLCASIYAYQASKEANQKRDLGFAYLTYDQGEVFDVIGVKGEYWLAKNQDDDENVFGWIWSKHFARLAS